MAVTVVGAASIAGSFATAFTLGRRPWRFGGVLRPLSCSTTSPLAAQLDTETAIDRVNFEQDVLGELCLPRPWFSSAVSDVHLWEALGVNVCRLAEKARPDKDEATRWQVMPQPASRYRAFRKTDEEVLLDMNGAHVCADRNPGVRVESEFVTEVEELQLVQELVAAADEFGYAYDCPDDDELDDVFGLEEEQEEEEVEDVLRMSGRDEGQSEERLAPWGYGAHLDRRRLPPTLAEVVERIEGLPGYLLGPLRDVTVNIRQNVDYEMAPHIDPPADGPNTFVLSLQSGAVITFSPVHALAAAVARANDPAAYSVHSFTDNDVDCLVARRSLYHMSGDARYFWTHAIRPPLVRDVSEDGFEAYDRWGTWEKARRRPQKRIAVILAFADPRDSDTS